MTFCSCNNPWWRRPLNFLRSRKNWMYKMKMFSRCLWKPLLIILSSVHGNGFLSPVKNHSLIRPRELTILALLRVGECLCIDAIVLWPGGTSLWGFHPQGGKEGDNSLHRDLCQKAQGILPRGQWSIGGSGFTTSWTLQFKRLAQTRACAGDAGKGGGQTLDRSHKKFSQSQKWMYFLQATN